MKLTFLLFTLLPLSSYSQFFLPSLEPLVGLNYYRSTRPTEDSKIYAGVSYYFGMRGSCYIGNRIMLSTAAGMKAYPYSSDYFINASVKAFVYRDYQTGFSVFCELGGEISDWGGLTLPFYLGTNQYFAESVSFNFKVRIPTFFDVKFLETVGHIELGMEAGLQFDLNRKPKKITGTGNPFILL
jgi:hypothetical protein